MKSLGKVKIAWSDKFAYAIGLIATDGNLSPDGRHIVFTTKDKQLADLFKECLGVSFLHVGMKSGGVNKLKEYYVVQIGDVSFYKYLNSIGLKKKKSKTIRKLKIPDEYFWSFLRGCIDGDGNIQEYMHPQSKLPQLKLRLYSASKRFVSWIKGKVSKKGIKGYYGTVFRDLQVLTYAKNSSIELLNILYKDCEGICLERKYLKAKKYLRI